MNNNWDLIEKNDAGKNAMGGTELFMRFLYDDVIPRTLLEQTQIIPGRVRTLNKDKIRILTLHDLPEDAECSKLANEKFRDQFHKLVFISNWQYQRFQNKLNLPYSLHSQVIENGLRPIDVDIAKKFQDIDTINIAYITTPHRGLSLLCPIFESLAATDKKIHLHVHSSFMIYGWENSDKEYEHLFEFCRKHPQVTYHGFTEFNALREILKTYHICAYPCIWEETACRSILEAMSAGMLCVHPNYGALTDTTGGLNIMYNGTLDISQHATQFIESLRAAITLVKNHPADVTNRLSFNKAFIDTRYDPRTIKNSWIRLLSELVQRYPDEQSRDVQKEMFVYKV